MSNEEYLVVKFDSDDYPDWRGSVDRGRGIVFIDTRFNPEFKYIAMGHKTNDPNEAIAIATRYTINKRNHDAKIHRDRIPKD